MKPIKTVIVVYRNRLAWWLRWVLPKRVLIRGWSHGREFSVLIPVGQRVALNSVRGLRPARIIDAIAFLYLVSDKESKYVG